MTNATSEIVVTNEMVSPTNKQERTFFRHYNRQTGHRRWNLWLVLLVEAIGTFLMTVWILMPNIMQVDSAMLYDPSGNIMVDASGNTMFNPDHWAYGNSFLEGLCYTLSKLFEYFIFSALWVTVGILILVLCCIWVTANFNPCVTTIEMDLGHDTKKEGFLKILIQFASGTVAGFFGLYVAESLQTMQAVGGTNLDTVYPAVRVSDAWNEMIINMGGTEWIEKSYTDISQSWFWFVQIVIEAILVFALLALVFGFRMNRVARTLFIVVGLTFIVWIGCFTYNFSLNPARLLGPTIAASVNTETWHAGMNPMTWVWIFLIGQMLGTLLFKASKVGNKNRVVVPTSVALFTNKRLATKSKEQQRAEREAQQAEKSAMKSLDSNYRDLVNIWKDYLDNHKTK